MSANKGKKLGTIVGKAHSFNVRLGDSDYSKLVEISDAWNVSKTEVLRKLINAGYKVLLKAGDRNEQG